jgi:DNA repair exonuclease SbcCD ATPase subunit
MKLILLIRLLASDCRPYLRGLFSPNDAIIIQEMIDIISSQKNTSPGNDLTSLATLVLGPDNSYIDTGLSLYSELLKIIDLAPTDKMRSWTGPSQDTPPHMPTLYELIETTIALALPDSNQFKVTQDLKLLENSNGKLHTESAEKVHDLNILMAKNGGLLNYLASLHKKIFKLLNLLPKDSMQVTSFTEGLDYLHRWLVHLLRQRDLLLGKEQSYKYQLQELDILINLLDYTKKNAFQEKSVLFSQVNDLMSENSDLQKKVERLTSQKRRLTKKINKLATQNDTLSSSKHQILRPQDEKSREIIDDLEALQESMAILESSYFDLLAKLSSLEKERAMAMAKSEDLEAHNEYLTLLNKELTAKLEQGKKFNDDLTINTIRLNEDIDRLTGLLQESNQKNDQIMARQSEDAIAITSLQQFIIKLNKNNDLLKEKLLVAYAKEKSLLEDIQQQAREILTMEMAQSKPLTANEKQK